MQKLVGEHLATARRLSGDFSFDDATLLRPMAICAVCQCGIGFCAEHSAIAEMLKSRESEIDLVVAVGRRGILSPCGRCRELMVQINAKNLKCRVVLSKTRVVELHELLPEHWKSEAPG